MAVTVRIINKGVKVNSFVDSFPRIEEIISHSIFSKLLIVFFCLAGFYFAAKLLNKIIHDISVRRALGDLRVLYITRLMNIGMVFCCIVVMCLILGLGYSEISVFLSSIFAVVGIALFAQWSILSNVTASMIIFFGFPYKVGDRIKVLDKDDDMRGDIVEISMFHVILKREDGNLITYPNTLILQKAVLKIDHPLQEAITENAHERERLAVEQMSMADNPNPEKLRQQQ
ncbi:mechanosensitive ion channel domain-containing protein [Cellvibrio sp. pealriver]|uniref:mechanosensitive ion channel domain-containing protein n=1 Tax=Cellvibrio sp. pealriver TaxID=1622269 RepID=UPI00069D5B64|nr:mechanosensitive ion channel domain-containing protein [Cellvibrio sp. pealriver]